MTEVRNGRSYYPCWSKHFTWSKWMKTAWRHFHCVVISNPLHLRNFSFNNNSNWLIALCWSIWINPDLSADQSIQHTHSFKWQGRRFVLRSCSIILRQKYSLRHSIYKYFVFFHLQWEAEFCTHNRSWDSLIFLVLVLMLLSEIQARWTV